MSAFLAFLAAAGNVALHALYVAWAFTLAFYGLAAITARDAKPTEGASAKPPFDALAEARKIVWAYVRETIA